MNSPAANPQVPRASIPHCLFMIGPTHLMSRYKIGLLRTRMPVAITAGKRHHHHFLGEIPDGFVGELQFPIAQQVELHGLLHVGRSEVFPVLRKHQ